MTVRQRRWSALLRERFGGCKRGIQHTPKRTRSGAFQRGHFGSLPAFSHSGANFVKEICP
ncbi:hypothetical protein LBMAG57_32210 [Verrucomicrobiota bacterium]|nr:hypothetical protein LBMAG57_32210 [Verrucomicrobiota bacterium]